MSLFPSLFIQILEVEAVITKLPLESWTLKHFLGCSIYISDIFICMHEYIEHKEKIIRIPKWKFHPKVQQKNLCQ